MTWIMTNKFISNLRCLEEEDSPVWRFELENVGFLAVVAGPGGQSVMHTHCVFQVHFRKVLIRLILILNTRGRQRAGNWVGFISWVILQQSFCAMTKTVEAEANSVFVRVCVILFAGRGSCPSTQRRISSSLVVLLGLQWKIERGRDGQMQREE